MARFSCELWSCRLPSVANTDSIFDRLRLTRRSAIHCNGGGGS
ncbi:hypothetical protein ACFPRL_29045 [Pseudoclavibacter helvolus]